MADIAAANVTYTVTKQRKEESGNKINSVTIAFGNGALTYPANGIPLTKASMGCPNAIVAGHLVQSNSADGIIYKYDQVNNKIRMYRSPTHTHDLFVATGGVDTTGSSVQAITGEFSISNAAVTIAGIPAASGAAGGVVNVASGDLIELVSGTTAVAAATLYMEVIGW